MGPSFFFSFLFVVNGQEDGKPTGAGAGGRFAGRLTAEEGDFVSCHTNITLRRLAFLVNHPNITLSFAKQR